MSYTPRRGGAALLLAASLFAGPVVLAASSPSPGHFAITAGAVLIPLPLLVAASLQPVLWPAVSRLKT